MGMVQSAADVNTLAAKVHDTGGLYFVTAFGGLFAPYWDPGATGMIIGALINTSITVVSDLNYLNRHVFVYRTSPHRSCYP